MRTVPEEGCTSTSTSGTYRGATCLALVVVASSARVVGGSDGSHAAWSTRLFFVSLRANATEATVPLQEGYLCGRIVQREGIVGVGASVWSGSAGWVG